MNTSTQLKALERNLSKKTGDEAETLLRNFMMERFLERIALSGYRNSFILKGGILIAAMVGIDTRSTLDMDATLKGQKLTAANIAAIINDIIAVAIDDGMQFSLSGIEEIHEEADYLGFRVSISAQLDKTRQMLKVDITTGDPVTPKEIEYGFKLMFEDRVIQIMAYNLETVLAEKLETIITRGLANTRMKDFYDIYIMTLTRDFDRQIFNEALRSTAEKRGTSERMRDIADTLEVLAQSPMMFDLWQRYAKKYSYAALISWSQVIKAAENLAAYNV